MAEKDLGFLVNSNMPRSQQCTLAALKVNCIVGCIRKSVASKTSFPSAQHWEITSQLPCPAIQCTEISTHWSKPIWTQADPGLLNFWDPCHVRLPQLLTIPWI